MKWSTIKNLHMNTNNISAFKWEDGMLHVFFVAEGLPESWEDPDRELYLKLCRQQGILPVMEGEDEV